MSAGINPCGAPGSLEKARPLPGRQPARAATRAGRSPVLGSHGKSPPSTKREQRERPADNHRSGKLIVPLWGCLAGGKNGAVQPPREFGGGGTDLGPGIATAAMGTLSNRAEGMAAHRLVPAGLAEPCQPPGWGLLSGSAPQQGYPAGARKIAPEARLRPGGERHQPLLHPPTQASPGQGPEPRALLGKL